ncbi:MULTISPECIES: hypothetical protein [unclassified Streptomyces]|uniref:hypothetical protein n=1 Tax=Streptomyces sp. SYP-A7185 TaxID=3040076 RepID=UPI0038F79BEE
MLVTAVGISGIAAGRTLLSRIAAAQLCVVKACAAAHLLEGFLDGVLQAGGAGLAQQTPP